ncbi:hypothetical protein [Streptomyces flaveolus]|uniref:hypothetical protein n=1 Tax=Streptomyces flaveolus TaxID=67297 RepID=UPI00340F0AD3
MLADYLTNRLYVMAAPGTGGACRDVPGVRVLSVGSQVLVPVSGVGTAAAHWVSAPKGSRLVNADKLARAAAVSKKSARARRCSSSRAICCASCDLSVSCQSATCTKTGP